LLRIHFNSQSIFLNNCSFAGLPFKIAAERLKYNPFREDMMADKKWRFDTLAVHLGNQPEKWQGASQPPIYQCASHRYETAEELSDVFAGKTPGYIYQRMHNPTSRVLEERIAGLEGGAKALVFASGMSAITNAVLALVRSGDEVVSGDSLFLTSYNFFTKLLPRLGVKARLVDTSEPGNFRAAINEKTRAVYVETIGNPRMDVPALREICKLAHNEGVPVLVDNTLATPYLFRPIEAGADIVIHSTTKFLNGHGSAVGGAVVDSGRFNFRSRRFPDFADSVKRAGKLAFYDKLWREVFISLGAYQSPFHSYLTLLGLETLGLRMERHLANAQKLARYLEDHRKVKWVNFPGLKSSPYYKIARRQFKGKGFGSLLTFGLKDQAQCFKLIRNLKLCYHLANLGDAKTLVIHPYSSQYVSFSEQARKELSIQPGMIRVSVGIEAGEDIIGDFEQALKKI
jgi:O-acetylhomoserine (thiol)-lyase